MLKGLKACFIAAFFTALPVCAVTPSPAMIAQFQKLPPAEQQRLAKQYGVTLPAGMAGASKTQQAESEVLVPQQQKVAFDEMALAQVEPKESDPSKQRFGLNMFNSQVSTFAPVDNGPVPDNYRLGPDDIILLQLFGKQSAEHELLISRTGEVNLPEIGPLTVSGLSLKQASALIISRLKEAMIGVDAAVSMGKLRTINVMVAGEAKTPGMYAVSAMTTVTQTLYVAGGVSDIGSLRDIQVKRAGQTVGHFDLYNLLLRGDSSADVQLQHGDVVFIAPMSASVEVAGAVKRPALYEVKSGETIDQLLAMAGGASAGAYPQSVVLERFNSDNLRDLLNLDLTNKVNRQMALRDGDVLRLPETSPRIENVVTIAGAAVRPGHYSWQQGMKVNDLIKSFWADLHMTADLDYALVVREINKAGDVKVLQFSLANAINNANSSDNLLLKPRDLVLVFNHANEFTHRDAINAYLRKKLIERNSLNEEMRWAGTEDLSTVGFNNLLLDANQQKQSANAVGKSGSIAGQSIVDRAQADSSGAQLTEGGRTQLREAVSQNALPEIMSDVMKRLYHDKELLALSASFNRTELLYPLLAKLKAQSRSGQTVNVVRVGGEVRVPGEYPLAENAKVTQLVSAAGGVTDAAYLGRAELTRAVSVDSHSNGVQVENIAVDLQGALAGSNDIALQSRDRLNVFPIPDWNIDNTIEIRGEVKFPGRYTIQRGEMLSDIIARAGGLSRNAFMQGVVYTRESVKERERLQLKKLTEQLRADIASKSLSEQGMTTSPQDALLMIGQIENQPPVGRLVLDMPAILAGEPEADIQVENGDLFYIPRMDSTVSIVGEVQHASSHRFKAGLTVDDYLSLAGGLRKRADSERVYVIKANGSVVIPQQNGWFAVKSETLEPGDTIIVPVDTEYKDSLSLWTAVTQIFYQSAVAVAAINSF